MNEDNQAQREWCDLTHEEWAELFENIEPDLAKYDKLKQDELEGIINE